MLDFEETQRKLAVVSAEDRIRRVKGIPDIDPVLRLKWGLALLGDEKAKEYLEWLQTRLDDSRQPSHTFA
jgi:hypothetical protein